MVEGIPDTRLREANGKAPNANAKYILYWMTAFRRTGYNFALEHACNLSQATGKPLLVLEALRVGYRWASDRFHRFIVCGMSDNKVDFEKHGITYFPYVEEKAGTGKGLVESLAEDACQIVTDDFPCFFHPRMVASVSKRLKVPLTLVDSNCLMPLSLAEKTFTVAHSYRRWMQKTLPEHLVEFPDPNPLAGKDFSGARISKKISQTWPMADLDPLLEDGGLSHLQIDHSVKGGASQGGANEARNLLARFLTKRLSDYDTDRNEPDELGSSELSPHLHFGHISAHEVFQQIMEAESWAPNRIQKVNGKVNGFWGVSESAEAFLDQLCTWREIGFNMCFREPEQYDCLESLPDWTKKTIEEHRGDQREYVYDLNTFESASTHDPIWNAAQRQLVQEGRIHNYLRMLWGKKILHWTASVESALDIMIELNNKYALDGRDPNSYSGIFWVLGRYDRAWGPERSIFGKIRYMTSENTAKKHKLGEYLKRFAE